MTEAALKQLAEKYLLGTSTPEEEAKLHRWYEAITDEIKEEEIVFTKKEEGADAIGQRILNNIRMEMQAERNLKPVRNTNWKYISIAASVAVLVAVGSLFLLKEKTGRESKIAQQQVPAIKPGSFKAVLTLADNSTVLLGDTTAIKALAQGSTLISQHNGALEYSGNANAETVFNVLATPRGGKYSLTLSDGTRVWLNAASSIKYPVSFTAKERSVTVSGEAYFEIAKDEKRPFFVKMDHDVSIQVLGTSFNVMAYPDENISKTTLVSGAVKFINGKNQALLKPGQQAVVAENSDAIKIDVIEDTAEVTAWKDGSLHFRSTDVPTLMRHLSRWYNIDVVFPPEAIGRRVSGDINMNTDLSTVIDMLDFAGLHLAIENNKLIMKSTNK